jgi:hypothetical protein
MSTQNVSTEIMQQVLIGQESILAGQRIAQEEQRIAQEEQRQFNRVVVTELAYVKSKLDIIDKNVLSVPGLVMSAFANMSTETKEHTEEELTGVIVPEVLAEIVDLVVCATQEIDMPEDTSNIAAMTEYKQAIKKRAIARAVGKQRISPAKLNYWKNDATNGEKKAAGNWVNQQLALVTGIKMQGFWHPKIQDLAALFLGFYATERVSGGRMY